MRTGSMLCNRVLVTLFFSYGGKRLRAGAGAGGIWKARLLTLWNRGGGKAIIRNAQHNYISPSCSSEQMST